MLHPLTESWRGRGVTHYFAAHVLLTDNMKREAAAKGSAHSHTKTRLSLSPFSPDKHLSGSIFPFIDDDGEEKNARKKPPLLFFKPNSSAPFPQSKQMASGLILPPWKRIKTQGTFTQLKEALGLAEREKSCSRKRRKTGRNNFLYKCKYL